MNKSYDVYLCRNQYRLNKTEKQLAYADTSIPSDDLWNSWANKVARDGFLKRNADGKLVRSKE